EPDEECAGRADPVAGTGDRNQSREKSVRGESEIPLARARERDEQRGQAGRTCRHRGVEGDTRNALNVERGQRAARIEAVPAKPEDQAANGAEDDVVRQHRAASIAREDAAETRTKRNGAGK